MGIELDYASARLECDICGKTDFVPLKNDAYLFEFENLLNECMPGWKVYHKHGKHSVVFCGTCIDKIA